MTGAERGKPPGKPPKESVTRQPGRVIPAVGVEGRRLQVVQHGIEPVKIKLGQIDDGKISLNDILSFQERVLPRGIHETDFDGLRVDHETAAILQQAIRKTEAIEKDGPTVDCQGFATILCGGKFDGFPEDPAFSDYPKAVTSGLRFIDERTELPFIEPLVLMRELAFTDPNKPQMSAVHYIVRLPVGEDVYVQKFRNSSPVATTLKEAADYYRTTHVGIVDSMQMISSTGEAFLEYKKEGFSAQ